MFSKQAIKFFEIFTVDLTLCNKRQIDGEYSVNFVAFLEDMNINEIETNVHTSCYSVS